ncbi:MAG TPA: sulfotransferase domain-containing protein [Gammaproteobacteria bacterium]|nr:sulfotransferase domain-containing protein [Gammaproteobacteria bacterium]
MEIGNGRSERVVSTRNIGEAEAGKTLDFLVIGAQKAGTTTLFKHMQGHPELHLPPEKEAPFFTRDDRWERGWRWYEQEFLPDVPEGVRIGKVTPHYLADPRAPRRIRQMFPRVKLIAILREPCERALSHYRMSLRRGIETRGPDEALRAALEDAEAGDLGTDKEGEARCYIAWSEYGRLLEGFRKHFPTEQLQVLFLDDLRDDPGDLLGHTFDFLGVDAGYEPPTLGKKYYVGGTRNRITVLERFDSLPGLRFLWKMIPERKRRVINFWMEHLNVVPSLEEEAMPSEETMDLLRAHFRKDLARLTDLLGHPPPWDL